eukprot:210944-Pleurochrysis_carterae.AAC.1
MGTPKHTPARAEDASADVGPSNNKTKTRCGLTNFSYELLLKGIAKRAAVQAVTTAPAPGASPQALAARTSAQTLRQERINTVCTSSSKALQKTRARER